MKFSRTLAAIVIAAFALPASALTVYTLDQTLTSGLSGPFGTVTLTQDGATQVDVSVALASGFKFVETGGPHDAFTFNVSGPSSYTVSNIVSSLYSRVTPGTNPAYGSYTDALVCDSCKNGSDAAFTSTLTFSVDRAAGISESSFAANALGFFFSADVTDGVDTGAVAAGAPLAAIPEPETYALMLAGLGVIGFVARRRRPQA